MERLLKTERFLTECNNSCAQDDVIRGELDVLYEGAGMLRCPRCEVISSLGKDTNSHWKEAHGENVVGYTCEKCEKKFKRLTKVRAVTSLAAGAKNQPADRGEDSNSDVSFALRVMILKGGSVNI